MEWVDQVKTYFTNNDELVLKIFIIVFLTMLINYVVRKIIIRAEKKLDKTVNVWDDAILASLIKPLNLLVWIFGLSLAASYLNITDIEIVQQVGIIFVIAWTLVRFTKEVENNVLLRGEKIGNKIDKTTADAIAQLLRISIIITASLVALQTLGFNISAILAFGGIGGIAIGFAAKDLLANFFGGMMIYLDRPFAIGDWIRSPDKKIEGTVEKIGWRLTVIRTFDKRPLYIPNAIFSTISVENPSRMSHRRIYETFGLRYDDIAQLPSIVSEVKEMLLKHPDIEQSQTMIVNFNEFAASSLNFFIYTFTKTTDWIEFHKIKQDVLFKVISIVEKHGAEMAFPTSTIHIPENINTDTLSASPGL